jgi:hypothetical protein
LLAEAVEPQVALMVTLASRAAADVTIAAVRGVKI